MQNEVLFFESIIKSLGFQIYEDQPHNKGERDLAISGLGFKLLEINKFFFNYNFPKIKKIILLGEKNGQKVVIKCTEDKEGRKEILEEKKARENIKKIDFAYHEFLEPKEIYFEMNEKYIIQINEFISEEKKFTERDPKEQFDLVHKAFVVQEGVHAVTAKHNKIVKKLFKTLNFNSYADIFLKSKNIILNKYPEFSTLLNSCESQFINNKNRISQYCGFLTHTDFVPHNFRIKKENGINKIFLLDHSAVVVGNKHDGWARFLNWSVLHSPILEQWFLQYFKINRSEEENESLRLMRIFRLFELLALYTLIEENAKKENKKDLATLSHKRVLFWTEVLKAIFENRELEKSIIEEYRNTRDNLRSREEKERQKVLY